VQLLLDTHVVLWWLDGGRQLRAEALDAIAAPTNTVWLSAVVVWEIRIKQALGKLVIPDDFAEVLEQQDFEALPVRISHAHRIAQLPALHRDPFDRLLVAQALEEDLCLVSRDASVTRYPVNTIVA